MTVSHLRSFMARIVDKEEKRCDIARASVELFFEKGFQQTSIDEIAKSAGVAKGTVYLYFKNKDEIIFTIWDLLALQHKEKFLQKVSPSMSAQEKIMLYYNFEECLPENKHHKILNLYQQFVSTMLIDQSGLYTSYFESFFQEDYTFLSQCLKEGIAKGEMEIDNVDILTNCIIVFTKGLLIKAKSNNLGFSEVQQMLLLHIAFILNPYIRKIS